MQQHILILEDTKSDISDTVTAISSYKNFSVCICETASQAINHLKNKLVSSIIINNTHKKASTGINSIKRIRKLCNTPVLFISNNLRDLSPQNFADLQPVIFFEHPVKNSELIANLHTACALNNKENTPEDQEETYRNIIENINDIVYLTDNKGIIKYISPQVEKITGFKPTDITGRHFNEFIHEDDFNRIMTAFKNLKTNNRLSNTYRFITKKKKVVWFNTSTKPVFKKNKLHKIIGIITDITSQTQTEKELNKERYFNNQLLQSSPALFVAIDSLGKILVMNSFMLNKLGYTMKEVAGKKYIDMFIPDDEKTAMKKVFKKLFNKNSMTVNSNHILKKNGEKLYVEWHGRSIFSSENRFEFFFGVGIDVTERDKSEKALMESERKFKAFFNNTFNLAGLLTPDGKIFAANDTALNSINSKLEDIKGKYFWNTPWWSHSKLEQEKLKKAIKQAARGKHVRFETTHPFADDEVHTLEFSIKPLKDESGKVIMLIPESIDITERKQAENIMKASEDKFSKAFMNSPFILTITELDSGKIIDANERFYEIFSYTKDEITGKTFIELGFYANPDDRKTLLAKIKEEKRVRNFEVQLNTKSRQQRLCSYYCEIITINKVKCLLTMMEDITEKRQLETEISHIIEKERFRIGRDLHDDLGQVLTGASFLLQSIQQEIDHGIIPEKTTVEKIGELIRNAVTKTRGISKMLSPIEMDKNSLVPALEEMANHIKTVFNISCTFTCTDEIIIPANHIAVNLYYITREAVNNAIKHSNASHISIHMHVSEKSQLSINIQDNGKGCDVDSSHQGMGLRIMKYRAQLISAKIAFYNNKKGFTVELNVNI